MSENTRMAYEAELDGLRAVAVIGVILFHLGLPQVFGGFTGVDVFFVLSGYLITALIWPQFRSGNFSFADFYIRRARRLLPALFVVIVFTSIASWLMLSPDHLASYGRSAVHAAISISNVNFWLESGYFDSDKYTKPLLHTWSLGVEEQFYLIWPPLIMAIVALRVRAVQALALVLIVAGGFYANIYFIEIFPSAVFYLSPFRAWQFAAGGLLALILHQGSGGGRKFTFPVWMSIPIGAVGLALIVYSFLRMDAVDYPGWQALYPTIGTLLVVASGANLLTTPLLANPASRYLGRISYSLYLTHWPIIVFWRYYTNDDLGPIGMASCAALSLVTAIALYHLVESRFRRPWTSEPARERVAVPAGILASMMAVVLLSVYPWAQNGWTWRLSAEAQQIVEEMGQDDQLDCNRRRIAGLGRQCFLGRGAERPDLILLGDSHSAALARGIEDPLRRRGETAILFSSPGTIPFYGSVTYDNDRRSENSFDERIDWAINSPADTIVVHARFALHWLSVRPVGERQNLLKFVGDPSSGPPETIEQSQAYFREGLDRTLTRLKDSGKTIVLVGAVPFQGVNMQQCANRPTYLMSIQHMLETCAGFTREQSLARAVEVNGVLEDAARRHGVLWLNPTEILCPEDQPNCRRTVDDKLVFRDEDHLSTYGARLVTRQLLNLVDGQSS